MVKKITLLMIVFCCLILVVQQAEANTTVNFANNGGPDIVGFQIQATWADAWTFNLTDTTSGGIIPDSYFRSDFAGTTRTISDTDIAPSPANFGWFLLAGNTPVMTTGEIGAFTAPFTGTLSMARLLLTDSSTFAANLDFDPVNDIYTINNVPIPPTILLLGAGLVGLVGIRRRVKC